MLLKEAPTFNKALLPIAVLADPVVFALNAPSPKLVFVATLPFPLFQTVLSGVLNSSRPFAFVLANTKAVVAICVVFVPAVAVGAVGVPVNVGLAKLAFKFNTVCVAVEIGNDSCVMSLPLANSRLVELIDFTKEFASLATAEDASAATSQALRAIVFTASQFPGVKKVEVLVEGKPFEAQPSAVTTFVNQADEVMAQYPGLITVD